MKNRKLGRLALVIGSVVVAVAAALALRPRPAPPHVGGPVPGDYELSFVDRHGRFVSKLRGPLRMMLDPFLVYVTAPSQRTKSYVIDAEGFRGERQNRGRPLLVVLGGSAAFGQGAPSDEDTLPAQLAALDPRFDVVNAGVVGYLSGQELGFMVHRADALHPAAYVAFDGWNEIYGSYLELLRVRPNDFGFNSTFFVLEERLHDLAKREGLIAEPEPPVTETPPAADRDYFLRVAAAYHENLARMSAFAKSRGARFLVAFQPEVGSKPVRSAHEQAALDEWDRKTGYVQKHFTDRYAVLEKRTEKFCAEHGIDFVDLNANQPDDELFVDPVHMNRAGYARAAARIRDALP